MDWNRFEKNLQMLNIIYRTYPGYNKKKSLIAFKEKKDMIRSAFSSLLDSLEDLEAFVHIIVDRPNNEYLEFLKQILSKYKVEANFILRDYPYGDRECFNTCLDIVKKLENSYIFFCEDDYLINKSLFKDLMNDHNLNSLYYIFPYEHPDYDKLIIHKLYGFFNNFNRKKYKKCLSGCLTFFTNTKTIRRDLNIFQQYKLGLGDHNLWKIVSLPIISSYTIFKEIFSTNNKRKLLKNYLGSIFKPHKANIYYTENSYAIQLSNDCLPKRLELLKYIDNKNLFIDLFLKNTQK